MLVEDPRSDPYRWLFWAAVASSLLLAVLLSVELIAMLTGTVETWDWCSDGALNVLVLIPTLEEAFRQTVPSVITVPVDYGENMKLSEHLKKVYQ